MAPRTSLTSRVLRDGRGRFGAFVLVAAALLAVAAPVVARTSPTAHGDVVLTRFLPPMSRDTGGQLHVLGTDRLGRDVWARLLYGARTSLGVGVVAVLLSVALGVAIGATAGYSWGPARITLLAVTDFALAVPRVVLLLLLASLWQPSAVLVMVVLGLTGWMPIARLVHGEVRALATRPFVAAATALGASRRQVLYRHLLPSALTPVIVAAALGVGNAIMLEAGLSFLGLGVQPPASSWGNMIASGRDTIVNAPWVATAPGAALALVVVACTLLGDAVRDALSGRANSPGL